MRRVHAMALLVLAVSAASISGSPVWPLEGREAAPEMSEQLAHGGFPGVPLSYVEEPMAQVIIADDWERMVIDLDRLNDLPDDRPMVLAAAAAQRPEISLQKEFDAIHFLLVGTPLEEWAYAMVLSADLYGIDWRLLPVIAVLESSGGRNACGGNAWGFASCRVTFETFGEGLAVVASTLSQPPYAGRTFNEILRIWVDGPGGMDSEHAHAYAARGFGVLAELEGK